MASAHATGLRELKGITPGSRVDLFVGATMVGSADVATGTHLFAIPALKVGDLLMAQQSEYGGPADQAARSNPVQALRYLDLTVDTAQSDSKFYATKGLQVLVQATVTDAQTHQPVDVQVAIANIGKSIPSSHATTIEVPAHFAGTSASCSIVATRGLRGLDGNPGPTPEVRPPLKVVNTQSILVVDSSNLALTFPGSPSTHYAIPDIGQVPGAVPLPGVPRRKQTVTATLTGSVDYRMKNSTLQKLPANADSTAIFPINFVDNTLTVWVNDPTAPLPHVDFTAEQ
ncbi:hypothetical protein ABIB25_002378 [Nakamurella sp. UYEF19]|uniref:hypothetical protein n=1 Tax=Nakamurella sp. UYEF19 TaxID=1756392 RepID=UPI0033971BBE